MKSNARFRNCSATHDQLGDNNSVQQRVNAFDASGLKMTLVVRGNGMAVKQGGCGNQRVFTCHGAIPSFQVDQ